MSPIIHAEIGWLCSLPLARRRDRVVVTLAGVLPDLDGAGLLVSEELYALWHHKLAHGAVAGLLIPLLVLGLSRSGKAALLALLSFHLHIACDLVGSGPGWPIWYLWPFSDVEWLPSWQWDLASWQNSVIGLAVTLVALACALPFGRTPVEVFSLRADRAVVTALRLRFGAPKADVDPG